MPSSLGPDMSMKVSSALGTDAGRVVEKLYVAYYGRPADAEGLLYWSDRIAAGEGEAAIRAFGNSPEYQERFGDLTQGELINNLYQQLFSRDADSVGLEFYKGLLQSGERSLAEIALSIADGAQGSDLDTLENRLQVASNFTFSYGNYGGDGSAEAARDMLQGVDSSYYSGQESRDVAVDMIETGRIKFTGDDNTIPPTPEITFHTTGRGGISLGWEDPDDEYANHLMTNVYRSTENDFDSAQLVGSEVEVFDSFSDIYEGETWSEEGYYYWITNVSTSGVEGLPSEEVYLTAPEFANVDFSQTETVANNPIQPVEIA